MREIPVCKECGSEDVEHTAWMKYDKEEQKWKFNGWEEETERGWESWCNRCQEHNTIMWCYDA